MTFSRIRHQFGYIVRFSLTFLPDVCENMPPAHVGSIIVHMNAEHFNQPKFSSLNYERIASGAEGCSVVCSRSF